MKLARILPTQFILAIFKLVRTRLTQILPVMFTLASLTGLITPATAQESSSTITDSEVSALSERKFDVAPVIIDGKELFNVLGITAFPARERAKEIVASILKAAELNANTTVNMETRPSDFGPVIFAENIQIFVVTDNDAKFQGAKPDLLASLQADAVEQAIVAYRLERSETGRWRSTLNVVLYSALFIVFSFSLFWFRKRLSRWIHGKTAEKLQKVEEATNEIVRSQTIAAFAASTVRLVLAFIFIIALYFYLTVVLHSFAETRAFGDNLLTYLTDPVYSVLNSIISYIPSFLTLVVIAMITRFVIKTVRLVFVNIDNGTFTFDGFEDQWVWPTYNIVRAFILLLALIIAFPYIPGSSSSAFKGVSILLGVMMSFGSSSVVGNLLAGVFVIYKRSTNIGDRITVGQHTGDVIAIKLMETHLKSLKNELISIPNSLLLSTDVVNYSNPVDNKGLLVHTTVGIGYEEPQEKVEAMLIEASIRTELLKKSPKPFVLRTVLADYSVHYQINAYSKHGDHLPQILSDLHSNVLDVFNENKVQIMTPSYVADTPEPKIAPMPVLKKKKQAENRD